MNASFSSWCSMSPCTSDELVQQRRVPAPGHARLRLVAVAAFVQTLRLAQVDRARAAGCPRRSGARSRAPGCATNEALVLGQDLARPARARARSGRPRTWPKRLELLGACPPATPAIELVRDPGSSGPARGTASSTSDRNARVLPATLHLRLMRASRSTRGQEAAADHLGLVHHARHALDAVAEHGRRQRLDVLAAPRSRGRASARAPAARAASAPASASTRLAARARRRAARAPDRRAPRGSPRIDATPARGARGARAAPRCA